MIQTKTTGLQSKVQVDAGMSNFSRILVAEDELEMRKLIAWSIKRKGYEVIECGDGAVLMKHLGFMEPLRQENDIDLVVSDIRMPGTTGLQVLEKAKDHENIPPIILITAYPDQETYDKAKRLGARAVLAKPFDIDDLMDEITRILPIHSIPKDQVSSVAGKDPLKFSCQFIYKHVPVTSPIRDFILKAATKLNRYADHFRHCRVEVTDSNSRVPLHFVKIYVEVGAETLVSKSYSGPGEKYDNVYLAIRAAFGKVAYMLREQKQRNDKHRYN